MELQQAIAQGPAGRSSKTRTGLVGIGGALVGVALTICLLRPPAVVAQLGDVAPARLTDAAGKSAARPAGGALRAGDRVRAGAQPVTLTLSKSTEVSILPSGEMTVQAAGARLEQGGAIIDATATIEEVRVATGAGDVVLTNAKVEIRTTTGSTTGAPGGPSAVAIVRVEQGTVRLEAAGAQVALGTGDGGLMIAGRAPRRSDVQFAKPAALTLTRPGDAEGDEDAEDEEAARSEGLLAGSTNGRRRSPRPDLATANTLVVPVVVAVPVLVGTPTPAAVGGALAPGGARGVIAGVVELDGTPPAEEHARGCADAAPSWTVTRGRVAGVHVQIVSPVASPARTAAPPLTIELRGCGVLPGIVALPVGGSIELRSADDDLHDVRLRDGTDVLFASALSPARTGVRYAPKAPGTLRLTDEGRPGAEGHVIVSPHGYFAVTGADGSFRLVGVPPGHHTLRAWHPKGGERTAEVIVKDGETTDARFTFAGEHEVIAAATPEPREVIPPVLPPAPALTSRLPLVAAEDPEVSTEAAASVETVSDGRCHAVTEGSILAQACAAGGVPGAKRAMQQIVSLARAGGTRIDCETCHADQHGFALAPLARERLAAVLTAISVRTALYNQVVARAAVQRAGSAKSDRRR